jgi:hypothetical protein
MAITEQQLRFFETFGFLTIPGLLRQEIAWIEDEFEAVWRDRGVVHDGSRRSCIVPFIDQRERLCTVLDLSQIEDLVNGLLGPDANYLGGDGNFYTGDTAWHSDGFHTAGKYLKVAIYVDPVGQGTGCLRVIPGSHRQPPHSDWEARQARRSDELWGIPGNEVPAVPLISRPGDVVAFNHNLMHASFGGSRRRRMFTLNFCAHCRTDEEITDLEAFINAQARFWIDHLHSDVMRATAGPQRMRHLRQVIEHEHGLAPLAEKYRRESAEPSRG